MAETVNQFIAGNPLLLLAIATWGLVWKGLALWKSARVGSKFWFILILILNTLGLLEILYIFFLHKYDLDKNFSRIKFLLPRNPKKSKIK